VTSDRQVDPEINATSLAGWPLPDPGDDADKRGRGQVLVVGGSVPVPGAVILSGLAALRAGAGKLQVATVERSAVALGVAMPEALVAGLRETAAGGIDPDGVHRVLELAERADAVLIGPGMVDEPAIASLVERFLREVPSSDTVVVVDAKAITSLDSSGASLNRLHGRAIITPNLGELAALLCEDDDSDRDDEAVRELAVAACEQTGAVVATRGWVTAPDRRVWRHHGGSVGLGTSGSGDVLSGVVAGLAARGVEPAQAAAWALFAHGEAGERLSERIGRLGFLARELLDELPAALAVPLLQN
jgi:hydroxyethylthiazole kinase-like uncharacterized protein yjeF